MHPLLLPIALRLLTRRPVARALARVGTGVAAAAGAAMVALTAEQVWRMWRAWNGVDSGPKAQPYQYRAARPRRRVLVVGDSTGVGIGAERRTESIGALVRAACQGAELVNLSVSGSCLGDVPAQLERLGPLERRFDIVLLHCGGNDIMRTPNLGSIEATADALLPRLHAVGKRVVWLGPVDVGLAPLFRPPFSWWLSHRSRQAAGLFQRAARRHGVEYVGFHGSRHSHVLTRERSQFFSADGIHPSGHGYRYAYGWLARSGALGHAMADVQAGPAHAPPLTPPVPVPAAAPLRHAA